MLTAAVTAAGDTAETWANDANTRNEQDRRKENAPVLFAIAWLPPYLLIACIICSASAKVTASLGPNHPSEGVSPF